MHYPVGERGTVMLTLVHQKAKLVHFNVRKEVHGDEKVLVADLKFSFLTANDLLSEFDPALKSSLYRKPDRRDQLELEPGWLPELRFPNMAPIDWELEIVGGMLYVHYGVSERSAMHLDVRSADRFHFELMNGGSVNVQFRVQCRPDEQQCGKLCYLVQEDIEISLQPPDDNPQVEIGEPIEATA
jgi:hypothetical protein